MSVAALPLPFRVAQSWAVNAPLRALVVSSLKSVLGGLARMVSSDGLGVGVAAAAVIGASTKTAIATAASGYFRRFTRHILSINDHPSNDSAPVPVKVPGQPLHELESALAGGPVPPGRRHLRHPHAEAVGLDSQLQAELEAAA